MLNASNVVRFVESFTECELPEIHRDRVERLVEVLRTLICYYGAEQVRHQPCLEISETSTLLRIRIIAIPVREGPTSPRVRALEESGWLHREDPHLEEVLLQILRRMGNALVPEDDLIRRLRTPVSWISPKPCDQESDGPLATENGAGTRHPAHPG